MASVIVVAAVGVGLLWFRFSEMDKAGRALKEGDGAAAVEHLVRVARLGDRTAQLLLGNAYAYGWAGITKDDSAALYWFSRSGPIEGLPAGSNELSVAELYLKGNEGLKPDSVEGAKWLAIAAEAGNQKAEAALRALHQ